MHTGSCLCGAVTYTVSELPGPMLLCHCRTCRKTHASAFKVGTLVARANMEWTSGEHLLKGFESSPGKLRLFCSECGTHLMSARDEADHVALAVATLDTDPGLKPELQIWVSDKAGWFDPDPNIPAHAEFVPLD